MPKFLFSVRSFRPTRPEGSITVTLQPEEKGEDNEVVFTDTPGGELTLEPITEELRESFLLPETEASKQDPSKRLGKKFLIEITPVE